MLGVLCLQLVCTSSIVAVSTSSSLRHTGSTSHSADDAASRGGQASQPGSETLEVNIIPDECSRSLAPSSSPELLPEAGQVEGETSEDVILQEPSETPPAPTKFPLLQGPKVSLRIDGTFIVSNFTWLISSSVAPEVLQIYANSTAAAQFSVTALRVPVRPSIPPEYFVGGTITVENPSHTTIEVASIHAVLPWGQTASCKPDDLVLPAKVDPSVQVSCTFRLQYTLGLKPSSLRAHVNLVGSAKPLKSWPKPFAFDKADWSWSAGTCARVAMDFKSDATDVSVTHAGGSAPALDGTATEVCDEFAKWDFTVLVTPVGKAEGVAMVSTRRAVVGSCGCSF